MCRHVPFWGVNQKNLEAKARFVKWSLRAVWRKTKRVKCGSQVFEIENG